MERLFQTHELRKQISLDGLWDFQVTDTFELPSTYSDKMAVPACWEMSMPYCRHRGFAAYRKELLLPKGGNLRLLFKGVSHTCRVFWDGEEIGGHHNAYTPFALTVRKTEAGRHILEVLVDNSFSERSKLHRPNDYFTYGGITRPVFLEWVPDQYIERLEFRPYLEENGWKAALKVFLRNLSETAAEGTVAFSCADRAVTLKGTLTPQGETVLETLLSFESVLPWSPDAPNLYLLNAVLNEEDDLIDRIGFRVVGQANRRITVNGTAVFIKGVNRHEDHGSTGCAIPLQLMQTDIALIKDLGCNAVRTCHYQNDERFLDLCDEEGILVWEESHERAGDASILTDPLWQKQSMESMREMLTLHYNHPAIIMWACLNECPSNDPDCYDVYKMHLGYLKSDDSRLTTYACNKYRRADRIMPVDLCMDMGDLCSVNMYPRWYTSLSAQEQITMVKEWLSEIGQGEKALLVSEYGAGAIYNLHDPMAPRWSEEYQADCLEEVTSYWMSEEADVAGFFIWQFCDTKVSGDIKRQRERPGCRNNKGLVDEYRRPKMGYYTVKKLLN